MVLIQALPEDYNLFISSLLLKDHLDKAAVQNVFVHEDNQRRRRQEESPAIGTTLATSSSSSTTCAFCGSSGHSQDVCRQYVHAKDQVGRKKDKANAAQTPETPSEFAGNASAPSTSPSPIPPNFDWLADTGATSYMTPHCHWVRNYLPLRIPIRLADNSIVYSSGVGRSLTQL